MRLTITIDGDARELLSVASRLRGILRAGDGAEPIDGVEAITADDMDRVALRHRRALRRRHNRGGGV